MDSDKPDDDFDVTFNQNNEKDGSEGTFLGKSLQHREPKKSALKLMKFCISWEVLDAGSG